MSSLRFDFWGFWKTFGLIGTAAAVIFAAGVVVGAWIW
jgi:hypothetical protein